MPFVEAKCTSCGATLTVDDNKEAAICEYCGVPYIVEKAINNFHISGNSNISVASAVVNIHGNGPTAENLLKRAEQFEKSGNILKALEYYDRVLDLEAENKVAIMSVDRILNAPVFSISFKDGFINKTLILTRTELIIQTKRKEERFMVDDISIVERFVARMNIHFLSTKRILNLAVGSIKSAKAIENAIKEVLIQLQLD